MAITQDEMQSIVSAVLSSIRTNSRTIDQLTPVTSLSDNDSFEINGGKKITYNVLKTLIGQSVEDLLTSLNKKIKDNRLVSVDFHSVESFGELNIKTGDNIHTCQISAATKELAGLFTAADKKQAEITNKKANYAKQKIDELRNKIGYPLGLVALNKNGKIDEQYLPNPDFPAFAGTLFLIDDPKMQSYAGDDYSVVFLSSHNKFAAKVPANAIIGAEYYFNWSTADMYMDSSRTYPLKGRLWRGPDGILYYWDGETLLPVCGSNGGSSGEDPDVRKDLEDIDRRVSAIEDSGFVDEKRVKELINLFEVSSGSDSEQCGCPAISFAEIDSLFDSEQDVNPDLPEDAERISEAEINSMLVAPPVAQCPHEPYTGQGISIAELDALIQAT